MIKFCSKHGISAEIEKINMSDINKTYNRLLKKNVRYRFVIDAFNSFN